MRSGMLACALRLASLCAATLCPASALAIGILGFDQANTLDPGRVEAGGGAAFGDSLLTLYGIGRFGLLPDLELGVRGGIAHLSDADDTGFEIEGIAKFRFLRQSDTADVVTLSVVGAASLFNTTDRFGLGVDPSLLASHAFQIAPGQTLFVAAGLGLAVSFIENGANGADGATTQTDFGLLGSIGAGVDVIPNVRLGLEARLRDDLRRLGIGVTCLF
ncbi:MAG: hypothetical protein ACI9U2_004866 [Bradymonadia bacterium]|jgi:hypothetical protein